MRHECTALNIATLIGNKSEEKTQNNNLKIQDVF